MAKLLSELERFEQEMKELGSELSPSPAHTVTRLPIPASLPPPPPPPRPVPSPVSVISSPPVASSSAQPSSSSQQSPLAAGLLSSSISLYISQPVRPPPPKPPSLQPPAAPAISTGNVTATPWLVSPTTSGTTTVSSSVSMSAALPTSASSQFTYSTAGLPFPPPPPSNPPQTSGASTSYFPVPFHLQQQNPQPQQYVQYQSQPSQPAVVQAPQYTYPTVYQPPISTADIFSLPQQQQAQQLFQRDAQIITPEALESVKAALASGDNEHKAETKKKAVPRKAAGQTWEDATLADWPENDYRLFCGDLGNEVNDEVLTKAFSRFAAFNMARVVRDKRTGKTKGYGFVSFSTPSELALALKEMNGKYVGNRPIKLRKSSWKERTDMDALEKQKNNKRQKTSKKNVLHK